MPDVLDAPAPRADLKRQVPEIDPELMKSWHEAFLAALPRIQKHAEIQFTHLKAKNPEKFEDCIDKVIGLAWKAYLVLRLDDEKDPDQFISAIADFSCRQVRAGRDITGQERAKDVLSPTAQRTKGFAVATLPDHSTVSDNPIATALAARNADPADQAAFNIDTPPWIDRLPDLKKKVALGKIQGDTTLELAAALGRTPARVSQICREVVELYCEDNDLAMTR